MDPEVVPIAMASLLLSADPTLGELLPFNEDVDVFRFLAGVLGIHAKQEAVEAR